MTDFRALDPRRRELARMFVAELRLARSEERRRGELDRAGAGSAFELREHDDRP